MSVLGWGKGKKGRPFGAEDRDSEADKSSVVQNP